MQLRTWFGKSRRIKNHTVDGSIETQVSKNKDNDATIALHINFDGNTLLVFLNGVEARRLAEKMQDALETAMRLEDAEHTYAEPCEDLGERD